MNGRFVAYYRVSTNRQGIDGLGMEAQREHIRQYLNGGKWQLIAEFAEVESGKKNDRKQLHQALQSCRKHKATLLIAKIDRLARNAGFLLSLRDSGVDFIAVDLPHADRFTVGIMALVAEKEREMISQRTKDGLAAAKRRGIKLGNPNPKKAIEQAAKARIANADSFATELLPVVAQIQKTGASSLRHVAHCLNLRGYKTPRGKAFAAQTVKNLLQRGH